MVKLVIEVPKSIVDALRSDERLTLHEQRKVICAVRAAAAADRERDRAIYRDKNLCVDLPDGMIRVQGKSVRIAKRGREVLHYLVMNPGRFVGEREMREALWGVYSSRSILYRQVCDLRKILPPGYIHNIPGCGYTFVPSADGELITEGL